MVKKYMKTENTPSLSCRYLMFMFLLFVVPSCYRGVAPPEAVGPVPSTRQLECHRWR